MFIKLYSSEIPVIVDNLKRDPAPDLPVMIGMVMDNLGTTMEQIQNNHEQNRIQLASVGIGMIPAPTTMPCTGGVTDWFNQDWWKKYAEALWPVLQSRTPDDYRVHFDFENFYTSHIEAIPTVCDPLGGKAALEKAMQPWLNMIESEGCIPMLTPPSPPPNNNYMLELMIERAKDGIVYLQDQGTYGMDEIFLRSNWSDFASHLMNMKQRRLQIIEWAKGCGASQVFYQAGMMEQLFRRWSKYFRKYVHPMYLEQDSEDYWMYCDDKRSQATKERGGYASFLGKCWYEGTIPATPTKPGHSLNDCNFYPLREPVGFDELHGGLPTLTEMFVDPLSGHEVASGYSVQRYFSPFCLQGWSQGDNPLLCNQRYLTVPNLGHTDKTHSWGMDVYYPTFLPAIDRSLIGVWNARNDGGHKEWQLRELGRSIIFEYRDNNVIKQAMIGVLALGHSRIVVRWDAGTKLWLVTLNGNTTAIESKNQNLCTANLTLGMGSIKQVDWTRIYSTGIVFSNFHYWNRFISDTELTSSRYDFDLSKHYPF